MEPFLIYFIIIAILTGYVLYRCSTYEIPPFELNKGGYFSDGVYSPNFERDDLRYFLNECEVNSIPKSLGKEFIVAIYNTLHWQVEPNAPKLTDNLYTTYDIDEEIEDVINYIFTKHNVNHIRWNQDKILKLHTFKDILVFLNNSL